MALNDLTFEQQVFELTNQERVNNGLQPLKPNAELNYVADKYAQDMSARGVLSHTGPDGSRPWDRAKVAGYEAQTMGENIAAGQKTPQQVVQAWMNSPGHRANILRSQYQDLGIGFEKNYWVQNFGSGDKNPISNIPSESNLEVASNPTPTPEQAPTPIALDSTSNQADSPKPDEAIPSATPESTSNPGASPNPDEVIPSATPESTSNPGASPNPNMAIPKPQLYSNSFEPTAYEQYMLELVNRARANPLEEEKRQNLSLTEGLRPDRISYDVRQPLAWNTNLSKAAQDHNKWQEQNGKFSHYGDGGWPWERAYKAGYDMTRPQSSEANENLSMGSGSKAKSATQYVEERHNSLYGSSGHRANFFNSNWKEAGIDFLGKLARDGENLSKATVVQFFGKPASGNTFLTGVAYNDLVKDDNFYTPGEGLGGVKVEAVRQSDNKIFTTATTSSGGYQIALEAGDYQVTFSEGTLKQPITSTAKIGSQNVKVDLVADGLVQGVSYTNPDLVATDAGAETSPVSEAGAIHDTLTGGAFSDILTSKQDELGRDSFVVSQGGNVDLINDLGTNATTTEALSVLPMGNYSPIESGIVNAKDLIAGVEQTIPNPSIM